MNTFKIAYTIKKSVSFALLNCMATAWLVYN
jgi:hypothetical protein